MLSKTFIKSAIYSAVTVAALGIISLKYSVAINIDESSPYTVFLVKKGELPKNYDDYVVFDPPEASRYQQKFVKKVGGMPGDEVSVVERTFYINSELIGIAKSTDSNGNPTRISKGGVIPQGKYFIYSKKENSYDSKYTEIGLVPENQIIGVAIAIL